MPRVLYRVKTIQSACLELDATMDNLKQALEKALDPQYEFTIYAEREGGKLLSIHVTPSTRYGGTPHVSLSIASKEFPGTKESSFVQQFLSEVKKSGSMTLPSSAIPALRDLRIETNSEGILCISAEEVS